MLLPSADPEPAEYDASARRCSARVRAWMASLVTVDAELAVSLRILAAIRSSGDSTGDDDDASDIDPRVPVGDRVPPAPALTSSAAILAASLSSGETTRWL